MKKLYSRCFIYKEPSFQKIFEDASTFEERRDAAKGLGWVWFKWKLYWKYKLGELSRGNLAKIIINNKKNKIRNYYKLYTRPLLNSMLSFIIFYIFYYNKILVFNYGSVGLYYKILLYIFIIFFIILIVFYIRDERSKMPEGIVQIVLLNIMVLIINYNIVKNLLGIENFYEFMQYNIIYLVYSKIVAMLNIICMLKGYSKKYIYFVHWFMAYPMVYIIVGLIVEKVSKNGYKIMRKLTKYYNKYIYLAQKNDRSEFVSYYYMQKDFVLDNIYRMEHGEEGNKEWDEHKKKKDQARTKEAQTMWYGVIKENYMKGKLWKKEGEERYKEAKKEYEKSRDEDKWEIEKKLYANAIKYSESCINDWKEGIVGELKEYYEEDVKNGFKDLD